MSTSGHFWNPSCADIKAYHVTGREEREIYRNHNRIPKLRSTIINFEQKHHSLQITYCYILHHERLFISLLNSEHSKPFPYK
jgi:hypothetical protein